MKEITKISPEGLEIANSYLILGNIPAVSKELRISPQEVSEHLNNNEVKRYLDTVYLDTGYRNRNNIATVLDEIIASKLEEVQETGLYSQKDLADLLQQAHKMRMDEIKAQNDSGVRSQTNVQINNGGFGEGNYGKLMEKLFSTGDTIEG